ncbi:cytochrome P460 [Chryseobacterium lactis]|uniref:Cytochrome P460 n=1 Tax=Chryseobacterium lactis TaxID=1241981 RepID=A0A3G6RHU5_CHRLC|nr:heme-binding domain-containing protein [Chryseobacterium lactis]AZA84224.1 cytochrome P460 [Chryseobacterium lactis]AZB04612.1 cytochrome P460 [Chryseobacterium lactis]PNW14343.1 cytochrome P460 [Chryseobacterium lactis]
MDTVKKKRSLIAIAFLAILGIFGGLQLFNPPLEGKRVTGKIEAPREVISILENSCFNCHSNQQNLSWYDQIAPISWAVNKDVKRAREVLNFSEWEKLSPAEHQGKMYAILNMMQSGKMPLHEYTILHPSAKITAKDVAAIKKYTLSLASAPQSAKPKNPIAEAIATLPAVSHSKFPVSPNGVKYTDDFKNWKVISMSTLFDHSIRVIYGNDIAVKAVEAENFHPWPDGSIVVKSVWKQQEFPDGEIRPGAFVNAQFMVKDSKKYTDTEGWGFAKFSGNDLHPTGKSASFAKESCIACHRQLAEKTGYLFDVPMKVNTQRLIQNLQKK